MLGDKAYDSGPLRDELRDRGTKSLIIPIRSTAAAESNPLASTSASTNDDGRSRAFSTSSQPSGSNFAGWFGFRMRSALSFASINLHKSVPLRFAHFQTFIIFRSDLTAISSHATVFMFSLRADVLCSRLNREPAEVKCTSQRPR
jgi:hypothetical protein